MNDFGAMLNHLLTMEGFISILTLTILEIVLGIDNVIFISIIADKLPKGEKAKGRTIGLAMALIIRVILLSCISWLVGLTNPLFHLGEWGVTGRDAILFAGGVFLIYKTSKEIWEKVSGHEAEMQLEAKKASLSSVVFQIVLIDIVFSFDSILTAVAISKNVLIMISAVLISMIIMILFSGVVSEFINQNPRVKMLALAFLLVIGFVLLAESCKELIGIEEVPKSYIYVSLGFSLLVECLNLWEKRMRRQVGKQHHLVELKEEEEEKLRGEAKN